MKKLILLLLVLSSVSLSAQLRQRNLFVEGSVGFSQMTLPSGLKSRVFNFSPSFGLMLTEKTALIVGMNVVDIRSEGSFFGNTRNNSTSIFFGARQFFPISDKFYFYTQGLVGYGDLFADMYGTLGLNGTNQGGGDQVNIQVSPGFVFFPSPRWGLTTRIGTLGYRFKQSNSPSNFEFSLGSIRLGLLFRFAK